MVSFLILFHKIRKQGYKSVINLLIIICLEHEKNEILLSCNSKIHGFSMRTHAVLERSMAVV